MEINLNKLDPFAAAKCKMKMPVNATFSAHDIQIIVKPICRDVQNKKKNWKNRKYMYRCQREGEGES